MWRYIVKRVLTIIPVILLVAITIFTIMYFCPGDPAELMLGRTATPEMLQELREKLGTNKPFFVQLGIFLRDVFLRADFGQSYTTMQPVISEIASRFQITLVLAIAVIVIEVVVGIPLGIVSATHRNGWQDNVCMFIAILGISVPAFWLGIELLIGFSLKLELLPFFGVEKWTGWILPIICASLNGVARMARQARSSMLEVIRSDFITTGRAKGLSERTLLFKYALPNGLIPLIQTLGNSFGTSIGGTVVIESIFVLPGMGKYMVDAITQRDYPVVRGTVLILSVCFCITMLLVDLAFAFVDPRIKAQYEAIGKRKRYLKKRRVQNG